MVSDRDKKLNGIGLNILPVVNSVHAYFLDR